MVEWCGWAGAILDIDLTERKIRKEPLTLEMAKKYIGGSGLATRILYDEVGPETDPLSPDNLAILTNGPLCGTIVPSGARYELVSKSPQTGIYTRSNGGGFFGPEMKWAGYDMIIIRGAADKPVYLWINDDKVEIRDASHLWGKDTWVTQDMIRAELHDPEIMTLKIGPAGENLCYSSCVISDWSRAAGKNSQAAVWGAKRLKAIAIRGTKGTKIAKPDELVKLTLELRRRFKKDPSYPTHTVYGTGYPVWNLYRNKFYPGRCPNVDAVVFQEKFVDKNLACFSCDLHCSHYYSVKEGPYKGTAGEGMEGNAYLFACGNLEIDDMGFLCKYNNLCNQLGVHVDHPGTSYKWAMRLYEDGVITKEDTGGIEITKGNQEAVLKLLELMVRREGFGAVMDDYPRKEVVDKVKDSELYVEHIKRVGQLAEPDGLFVSSGITLCLAVAPRGQDHLYGIPFNAQPPIWTYEELEKVGIERHGDPKALYPPWGYSPGKAHLVFYNENEFTVTDQTGTCKFNGVEKLVREGLNSKDFARLMTLTTGVEFTPEEMIAASEREILMARAFNAREGIRREDDYPHAYYWLRKFGKPHPKYNYDDLAKRLTFEDYERMLDDYYRCRGCDPETGTPTRQKLETLGLQDVADDLAKRGLIPQ
ncbi:MAG: hypothetical protein HY670_11355 [Chloroflexi bacterium]|nr:hypothetical protein [Chloroflexota bacterium]